MCVCVCVCVFNYINTVLKYINYRNTSITAEYHKIDTAIWKDQQENM